MIPTECISKKDGICNLPMGSCTQCAPPSNYTSMALKNKEAVHLGSFIAGIRQAKIILLQIQEEAKQDSANEVAEELGWNESGTAENTDIKKSFLRGYEYAIFVLSLIERGNQ